jgi:hypothetical protein
MTTANTWQERTDKQIEDQVAEEGTHKWDCECGVHEWNHEVIS